MRRLTIDVTPLRESRDFRLLWTGEMLSQVGSQIALVALFVQIYALTKSSAAVGAVGLVQLLPMVVVSLGIGPQIDTRDRRKILLVAQIGLMLASTVLLFGARMDHPPLALLYSAAALNAAFTSISMPTRSAMTPNLVSRQLLAPAAALNQVMWNGAGVVGPALGGIVVHSYGLSWAYGIDVASYAVAIAFVLMLRPQRPLLDPDREPEGGLAAVLAGVRYLKGRRVLQSTFSIDVVAMVFGMPRVLFPALAVERFHSTETVGYMFSAVAAGAVVGGHLWIALGFLAIAGGADVLSAVFRNTIQQTTIPDELRGRIAAFNIFVVTGGPRLGDFEGGVIASIFSPAVSVVSGGVLCVVGVVAIAAAVPRFAIWRDGDPP